MTTRESNMLDDTDDDARRTLLRARIRERRAHIRHTLSGLEHKLDVVRQAPQRIAHAGRVVAAALTVGTTMVALALFVRAMIRSSRALLR
jgi:hypothetical protein